MLKILLSAETPDTPRSCAPSKTSSAINKKPVSVNPITSIKTGFAFRPNINVDPVSHAFIVARNHGAVKSPGPLDFVLNPQVNEM